MSLIFSRCFRQYSKCLEKLAIRHKIGGAGTVMLARDTAWAGASELGRALAGTLSFVVLARALGPGDFGRYAGCLALIWALMPFATLGRPHLIVMQVAHEPGSLRRRWSESLFAVAFGGCMATVALLLLRSLVMPSIPASFVLLLAFSEFIFSAFVEVTSAAAQAQERFALCAGIRVLSGCTRLAGAIAFAVSGANGLTAFSPIQLVACATGALAGICLMARRSGWPSRPQRPTFRSVTAGLPFSFGLVSFMTQDGVDKTIMVRYGMAVEAGAYSAAYRVVGFTLLPVTALLQATYARFFRAGMTGLASSWRLARRLLLPAVAYGAMAGLGLILFAPVLNVVLGSAYGSSVPMLRVLAFLPLVRILQYFPANALTGAGHYKLRSACQAVTALLAVFLCFAFIPPFGWKGAVLSTFAVELLFAGSVWVTLFILLRRERRSIPEELSTVESTESCYAA